MDHTRVLIITHIVFRNGTPKAGPYSSVVASLSKRFSEVTLIGPPLDGYIDPVLYGVSGNEDKMFLPEIFGRVRAFKYVIDTFVILYFATKHFVENMADKCVVIAIDPLSCLPLLLLKPFFKFKLVFYSIDFSKKRFTNNFMQGLYELSDGYSSRYSDQTWAVCDSLIQYKKKYDVNALYVPNSFVFSKKYYNRGIGFKSCTKVVWTGSILTYRQIDHIFNLCEMLQKLRGDLEFWFIPSNRIEDFRVALKKSGIRKGEIFDVSGQEESRKLVAKCDIGIALYDKRFGSTKYIEPIKIWEYMMCGVPFIISKEPSINPVIIKSGVAFLLDSDNTSKRPSELSKFIKAENLQSLREKCLKIAKEYSSDKIMIDALRLLK